MPNLCSHQEARHVFQRWLTSFTLGVKEQGEFFTDGDTTWFRYMAPLFTGAECLQCHAQQGHKEGDIRGGLSVSLPYPTHSHLQLIAGFGSVGVLGLIFIVIGATLHERKQRLFDATFDSPIPTCVTDNNHTILMANQSYWTAFGPLPDHRKTIKCHEHRPGNSCHTENCPLSRIMGGASQYTSESIKEKNGGAHHFIINAKPLRDARGKVVGSVESFQDITERKRAEEALAESNRKLEELSNTDGLTGIANRRLFDTVLAQEYARHSRTGGQLSLILLDIDHFKAFNDCYGHVSGDECLQQVAQVIATCATRPADLAARYGGEEFACILPDTSSSGAVAVAEKIRREIMARAIPHKGSNVADCVTASLGVTTVHCTTDGAPQDIVSQVDDLLYLAKSSGRNRVESFVAREDAEAVKGKLVQLAWNDSICCGDELIDSQHQSLLRIANELLAAILAGRPSMEISAMIARLLEDIRQHFHDEEAILEAGGFPGLEQHATEHANLLAKGIELAREFQASTLTIGDVFQFLAYEVVMLHMIDADRQYFPFVTPTNGAVPRHAEGA